MIIEEYLASFKKYIEVIIVPKYPEIQDFEVRLSGRREWSFIKKEWSYVVEIIFFVNGTEQELEDNLRDDIYNMKKVFTIEDNITIHFTIVIQGNKFGGDWYV